MKLHRVLMGSLILLVPTVFVFLGIRRDGYLSSGFEKVSNGMSRQEVVAIMGTLKRTLRCDEPMFAAPDLRKCAQIEVYPVSFAPLDPGYYAIYFDRDKRVIYKFEFQSP
jgi:hypothetical protein